MKFRISVTVQQVSHIDVDAETLQDAQKIAESRGTEGGVLTSYRRDVEAFPLSHNERRES
jgi:hypothetical protein